MKLKLTALALLGLSHIASASEITPFASENLTPPTNKATSKYRDCCEIMHKTSEDDFFRLIMTPSRESEAAVYALKNQNSFSGDQLYLFAQMLFKVGQGYAANVLLEHIVNRDTNNTDPTLLLKVAASLKLNNPILSATAYAYVTQNPQSSESDKATAKAAYISLSNIASILR